ncbi:acyl-sn-glycerol-3-phosphate acyltransferase, partial [Escherichia coli]
MNEQLNNKVFVVVDAKDEAAIQQATHFLTVQAKQSQLWQPLKPQLDFDQFAKQLYQHRAGLLSAQDQALLQKKDYAALTEQSLMQMMSPGMPVTAESLKQDPLLLFPRYAMQLATPSQQDIEMEQGFATIHHEQGISRLFVLQLTQSPYNIDYQAQTSTRNAQTQPKLA